MLITIESDSLKEMLDRVWLADVYGKRLEEIKKLMTKDTGKNDVEIFSAVIELLK